GALAPHGFAGPAFAAPTVAEPARTAEGEPLAPGAPVLLVAGIAAPERFLAAVRAQHLEIRGAFVLRDHHRYGARDRQRIERAFTASGARHLLTTGKDLVKLQVLLDLPFALQPVAARPEPAFWPWLAARLAGLDR
ncbi:MAG TPA: tetraacyldisaccharide 4'-kinase, partial [Thermoanaerobaculia bacterium]|nr:tetraacyldisaccharide 4'-kinase [Thermoanaerobaculia bacterium]